MVDRIAATKAGEVRLQWIRHTRTKHHPGIPTTDTDRLRSTRRPRVRTQ